VKNSPISLKLILYDVKLDVREQFVVLIGIGNTTDDILDARGLLQVLAHVLARIVIDGLQPVRRFLLDKTELLA
jgi:hypothetical protein